MWHVERRRPRHARGVTAGFPGPILRGSIRLRLAACVGATCLVLCAGVALGVPGGRQAGGSTTGGSLGLSIASYDGDSVTATPSESALAGTDVTDQLTVSNTTASTESNVVVPVDLPANFTLHSGSVTPSAGATTFAAGVLTWTVPSIAAASSETLSYTETTDAPGSLESDPTTASATSDQSTTPSTASASVEVIPAADLSISVTDGVDSIAPGSSDTYTITLTNNGPSEAPDATVTETFVPGFSAVSDAESIGGTTYADLGGGQFQWTGIDLLSGATTTLTLVGNIPSSLSAGSVVTSLATVSLYPGEIDTNPAYNAIDSDVVTGSTTGGSLGLSIASYDGDSVTATPSESALAGTDVTDQLTVSNTTASTESNVVVPVDLPANFTLHSGSVTPSAGATTFAAGVLTWTVPSIAAASSETLSYTETTDAPGSLESDPTTASATSDQSTTPSTASASVEVIPAADLSISVTDGVDSIAPGSSDTYTITLTNNGPSSVPNATVADTLNGGFTALFAVSSIGGTTFVDLGTDQFEWTGVDLASGGTATFNLMGTVSSSLAAGNAFMNLASVSAAPGEVDTVASSSAVDSDSVILAPQAISFTPPVLGVAGQSATLSGTGGGTGNPVVFSVDPSSGTGVCSVTGTDGTTLDYQEPGTCVVDANQAGNAGYSAAPTVTAAIAVEQVPAFSVESPPPTAVVGQDYMYTFGASGVPTPAYSLAPGAPSWLTIDPTSGVLAGTPPTGTTAFAYSVIATNSVGEATAGPFAVSVSTTTNSGLADVSAALSCPATVQVRAEGSCTLTVANPGPATARFVTAGITLPFRLWRVSPTRGGLRFGNARIWFLRSLPPGASVAFTVSFRAWRAGPGRVVGFGASRTPDPDHANNVAVATVSVTGVTEPYRRPGSHAPF